MSSKHHSDAPRHAKQKYSSLHAPRTAAAHTRSNKCSSDQWSPRAATGSKKKRRAAKPQKSATTGRKSTERSRSNEFSPNALSLPPSPTKAPRAAKQKYRPIKSLWNNKKCRSASWCHPGPLMTSSRGQTPIGAYKRGCTPATHPAL
ncbi:hypothetical protein TcCL_ESM07796 [Trypanosoma cruzi]|nr:hypothetical protein TcCL_ESM07796 [Trypanosoma cruzi]